MRVAGSLAIALTLVALDARAEPPTKEQCIQANVRAQDAARDHKFGAAKAALSSCLDAACPEVIRGDCAQRLDDLQKQMPSLIFAARDADGADVPDVTVTLDGAPLPEGARGVAFEVDPGEHTFVFRTPSALEPTRRTIVIVEGERNRREVIVFASRKAPDQPSQAAPPPPLAVNADASTPHREGQRTFGLVLGAAGLASLGVATYFGVNAGDLWSQSQSACGATCPNHARAVEAHDHALGSALASTTLFVAGGALTVGGALLVLLEPRAPSAAALRVATTLGLERAGLAVIGAF